MTQKLNNSISEKIFGICTYPIYGGGVIIFQELMLSLGVEKCFLNEKIKKAGHNFSGVNYISFHLISKSPSTWLKFLLHYFQMSFSIYNETKKCKMVIANDLVSLLYISPHKVLKKLDVYYFCHGAFRNTWFNRHILSRFINCFACIVVVPSLYLMKEITDMGVDPTKIHCIYNGIKDSGLPAMNPGENRDGKLKVGIVGIIQDLKGQDIFIEAIKNLNHNGHPVVGSIVGPIGEEPFYEELKRKAGEAEQKQIIRFIGALDHQSTLEFMNSQDVIISASKYMESLGIVLIEAMSLKKPVIGTRVGGIPEVIVDNETGYLIEPNNIRQLEEAILKMIEPETRKNLGEMGYKQYKTKFSREIFLKQHRILIEDYLYSQYKTS